LMNIGLLFTPVSVYQMVRGALVLWVGLFSVIFLRRRLSLSQWASLCMVMLGVCIVGLSNALRVDSSHSVEEVDSSRAAIGVFLILFAQVFAASQFVVEEKIMTRYSVEPLRAVGLEGVFGFASIFLLMILLHYFVGQTPQGRGGVFDLPVGFHQLIDNRQVWLTSCAIAISIAFFNFFGLAVTKSVSATARSTIDTCRTLGIWAVSLFLGWEHFQILQVLGFALLVYGTFVFNGILQFPRFVSNNHDVSEVIISDTEIDVEDRPFRSSGTDGSGSSRPRSRRTNSVAAGERDRRRKSVETSALLPISAEGR